MTKQTLIIIFILGVLLLELASVSRKYHNLVDENMHTLELYDDLSTKYIVADEKIQELKSAKLEEIQAQVIREQELISPLKELDKKEYIIQLKSIIDTYSDELDPMETLEDYYTDDEINIMLKCIETEVYDCTFDAKVNVASVILNRVEHDMFPSNPNEVVTSKNQFAYGRNNITDETRLALEYAFMIEDTTNGCIGFRSDCNPTTWNNWEYSFTDGYHYFYKLKGE